MSYDVSFKVRVENTDSWVSLHYLNSNITWNVRNIITKSTGLEWKNEQDNGLAKDVIENIRLGKTTINNNFFLYDSMSSPNGFGDAQDVVHFFDEIIDAWKNLCFFRPDLIDYAHFWIE